MSDDRTRQVVTVLVFIVTVAVNGAANALPINGLTTGEISDRFQVFVIPAGYVFAIWGVIYVGLAAFTIYQAMRGTDPVVRRVGWLPALSGVLNTTWLLLFQFEAFVLTVPVMLALLLTLIAIHRRVWMVRDRVTTTSRWTISVPFSIYLGWISVATIANVAQTLSWLGVGGFGVPLETTIASGVLLLGPALAIVFARRYGDLAFGAVIVWAYLGIVVKELSTPLVPLIAGIGAAVVVVVVLATAAERLRGTRAPRPAV